MATSIHLFSKQFPLERILDGPLLDALVVGPPVLVLVAVDPAVLVHQQQVPPRPLARARLRQRRLLVVVPPLEHHLEEGMSTKLRENYHNIRRRPHLEVVLSLIDPAEIAGHVVQDLLRVDLIRT